jgi:hypothetical protein
MIISEDLKQETKKFISIKFSFHLIPQKDSTSSNTSQYFSINWYKSMTRLTIINFYINNNV